MLSLARPGSAQAAPPPNDLFSGAASVTDGFSQVLNTTQATTDANDNQLNGQVCHFPYTDASVWYAVTVATDTILTVDVSGSNYSAGVMVGVGTEGNLQEWVCGIEMVNLPALAGTTYYVLVFDYQSDGGGNGGTLDISIAEAQPPTLELTVDPTGTFDAQTGVATLTGTYTCEHATSLSLFATATQQVGQGRGAAVQGSGGFDNEFVVCDGLPHPWSTTTTPSSGRFAGGELLTETSASVCANFVGCVSSFVDQAVHLHGGKK